MKTDEEVQAKWINAIKSCGQSLIDNAEEIAGDYERETGVTITIDMKPENVVEIAVTTTYLPKSLDGKKMVCL